MNKSAFINNICRQIAEMTDQNDHTGAVVAIAEYTNDIARTEQAANLQNWARYIQAEHNRLRHMPEPLLNFRSGVIHGCMTILSEMLPEDCMNELRRAL